MAQSANKLSTTDSSVKAGTELSSLHPSGLERSESIVEPMHSRMNPKRVVCMQCGSKILLPETAAHVRKSVRTIRTVLIASNTQFLYSRFLVGFSASYENEAHTSRFY